ncbi:MAG: hypothetical protein ABIL06_14890 [Pseudomonadota bacterium]|jgi:hypothetical protein
MAKGLTFESREESVMLDMALNPIGGANNIGVLAVTSPGIHSAV